LGIFHLDNTIHVSRILQIGHFTWINFEREEDIPEFDTPMIHAMHPSKNSPAYV
jgi:hypothetical protein